MFWCTAFAHTCSGACVCVYCSTNSAHHFAKNSRKIVRPYSEYLNIYILTFDKIIYTFYRLFLHLFWIDTPQRHDIIFQFAKIHSHPNWFPDGRPIKLVWSLNKHIWVYIAPLSRTLVQYVSKLNLQNATGTIENINENAIQNQNCATIEWVSVKEFTPLTKLYICIEWEKSLKVIDEQLKLTSKTVCCHASNNKSGRDLFIFEVVLLSPHLKDHRFYLWTLFILKNWLMSVCKKLVVYYACKIFELINS